MSSGVAGTGSALTSAWQWVQAAWDIWGAGKASPLALAVRRQKRLADLIAFAREHSAYYRDLYQDMLWEVVDFSTVPVVTKPELMANFERWMTDPQVRKSEVEPSC
jgi:hypothetical protein